jgi:hypothetical protein
MFNKTGVFALKKFKKTNKTMCLLKFLYVYQFMAHTLLNHGLFVNNSIKR